jgi:hypothetical protein
LPVAGVVGAGLDTGATGAGAAVGVGLVGTGAADPGCGAATASVLPTFEPEGGPPLCFCAAAPEGPGAEVAPAARRAADVDLPVPAPGLGAAISAL